MKHRTVSATEFKAKCLDILDRLGLIMGLLTCALVRRLGYLLDAKVYMIDHLPTDVSWPEVAFIGGMTLIICLLSTLYPALRAARLRPADGLRMD